jgi:uncharacterized protein (TIGR01370 family)
MPQRTLSVLESITAAGDPAAWFELENPDWPANYTVDFRDPAWQRIVLAWVDALVDSGSGEAYLDRVNAYGAFRDSPQRG